MRGRYADTLIESIVTMSISLDPTTVRHEVHHIRAVWSQFGISVTDAQEAELVAEILTWAPRTTPLLRGQRGVVSFFKPKTAALFADRVWLQYPGEDTRLDFAFGWESLQSLRLAALWAFHSMNATEEERESWQHETASPQTERFVLATERDLAQEYHTRTGAFIAPLYSSSEIRERQYHSGDAPTIIAVAENLNIVAEESLTWDQVIEFRGDGPSRLAYREFIHWLDKDMLGKPVQFIVDEVSSRLDKYNRALQKHGLRTVLGALERTLDAKSLLGTSAAAVAVQNLANQPLLSVLAAGGLVIGKTALTAALRLIERKDIHDANQDIAFVHQARSHFKHAAKGTA
jgi:hypothetical protein